MHSWFNIRKSNNVMSQEKKTLTVADYAVMVQWSTMQQRKGINHSYMHQHGPFWQHVRLNRKGNCRRTHIAWFYLYVAQNQAMYSFISVIIRKKGKIMN